MRTVPVRIQGHQKLFTKRFFYFIFFRFRYRTYRYLNSLTCKQWALQSGSRSTRNIQPGSGFIALISIMVFGFSCTRWHFYQRNKGAGTFSTECLQRTSKNQSINQQNENPSIRQNGLEVSIKSTVGTLSTYTIVYRTLPCQLTCWM